MDLLDKTYGSKRPQAQINRNQEAFRRMDSGMLLPGELYGLVTGAPAPSAPGLRNPVLTTGKRTTCLDCRGELEQFGPPLQSQPRRCVTCGKLRRRKHNDKQAEKKKG